MKHTTNQRGSSIILVLAILATIIALAATGWFVWQRNRNVNNVSSSTNKQNSHGDDSKPPDTRKEKTEDWLVVTTQRKGFSMKVPDGWNLTSYPDNFLGATEVDYRPGTPATVEIADTSYVGHMLRFRASLTPIDDAGFGQQWESPQPGLQETVEDFSIGNLQGKRFKGIFSGDIKQTLYEYVFDIGQGRKLDIVYTIHDDQAKEDQVAIVEKAIKTIQLK